MMTDYESLLQKLSRSPHYLTWLDLLTQWERRIRPMMHYDHLGQHDHPWLDEIVDECIAVVRATGLTEDDDDFWDIVRSMFEGHLLDFVAVLEEHSEESE